VLTPVAKSESTGAPSCPSTYEAKIGVAAAVFTDILSLFYMTHPITPKQNLPIKPLKSEGHCHENSRDKLTANIRIYVLDYEGGHSIAPKTTSANAASASP